MVTIPFDCDSLEINFAAPVILNLSDGILVHVPESYVVMDTITSFLNSDNYKDLILVLRSKCEGESESNGTFPEERPLIILIGKGNGGFDMAARNDNVVLCYNCGGTMGDPYQKLTVGVNNFTIFHCAGSAWRWTWDVSFEYDEESDDWYLSRTESTSFHAAEPDSVQVKIASRDHFGTISFKQFSKDLLSD